MHVASLAYSDTRATGRVFGDDYERYPLHGAEYVGYRMGEFSIRRAQFPKAIKFTGATSRWGEESSTILDMALRPTEIQT